MSELKPCPFCGGKAKLIDHRDMENSVYGYSTRCTKNGCCMDIHTRIYGTSEEATTAWNRRAAPENNPLTLEQLRQMDGKPVWCEQHSRKSKSGFFKAWGIIDTACRCVDFLEIHLDFDRYGKTWLAYAREPVSK